MPKRFDASAFVIAAAGRAFDRLPADTLGVENPRLDVDRAGHVTRRTDRVDPQILLTPGNRFVFERLASGRAVPGRSKQQVR